VRDAEVVSRVEGVKNLDREEERDVTWKRSDVSKLGEADTVDEFENLERAVIHEPEVEDRHHAGVMKACLDRRAFAVLRPLLLLLLEFDEANGDATREAMGTVRDRFVHGRTGIFAKDANELVAIGEQLAKESISSFPFR